MKFPKHCFSSSGVLAGRQAGCSAGSLHYKQVQNMQFFAQNYRFLCCEKSRFTLLSSGALQTNNANSMWLTARLVGSM